MLRQPVQWHSGSCKTVIDIIYKKINVFRKLILDKHKSPVYTDARNREKEKTPRAQAEGSLCSD